MVRMRGRWRCSIGRKNEGVFYSTPLFSLIKKKWKGGIMFEEEKSLKEREYREYIEWPKMGIGNVRPRTFPEAYHMGFCAGYLEGVKSAER